MSNPQNTPLTYNQYLKKWKELEKEIKSNLKIFNYNKVNKLLQEEELLNNFNINFLKQNANKIEDLYYEVIFNTLEYEKNTKL